MNALQQKIQRGIVRRLKNISYLSTESLAASLGLEKEEEENQRTLWHKAQGHWNPLYEKEGELYDPINERHFFGCTTITF